MNSISVLLFNTSIYLFLSIYFYKKNGMTSCVYLFLLYFVTALFSCLFLIHPLFFQSIHNNNPLTISPYIFYSSIVLSLCYPIIKAEKQKIVLTKNNPSNFNNIIYCIITISYKYSKK